MKTCTFVYTLLTAGLAASTLALGAPEIREIDPTVTDPLITGFGLPDLRLHQAAFDPEAKPKRNQLVVFLPDSQTSPSEYREFLSLVGWLGFHGVALDYSSDGAAPSGDVEGWHLEKIDGGDRHSEIAVDAANSIENRLVRLLQHLNKEFPAEQWNRFYDEADDVQWQSTIVAGHGEGGGHAAFIATVREVGRCHLYGHLSTLVGLIEPESFENGATPPERFYGFVHEHTRPEVVKVWEALGMADFGEPVVVEDSSRRRFGFAHQLTTNLAPAGDGTDFSGAVIKDSSIPLDEAGQPSGIDVWEHALVSPNLPPSGLRISPEKGGKFRLSRNKGFRRFQLEHSNDLGLVGSWQR